MRTLLLLVTLSGFLYAQEPLPWRDSDPTYHDATLELARHCLDNNLVSECVKLANRAKGTQPDKTAELLKACEGKADVYTAQAWGGYLDRREAVQQRRALGAEKAGAEARDILWIDPDHAPSRKAFGDTWCDGLGWLDKAEYARLSPLVTRETPDKAAYEPTWDKPYVLAGKHFMLVTDLPWARAAKYSGLLEQFHAFYFEKLGDVIPQRGQPNVVWCCAKAADFVKFSESVGFPMTATNAGLHVGHIGAVLINVERCDEVGRRNKSRDNLARTLFHECAHRLTESGLRGRTARNWDLAKTPEHAWIVESVAVVFEDLYFEKGVAELRGLEDQRKFTIEKFWKDKTGKVPALAAVLAQGSTDFATDQPVGSIEKYAIGGTVAWFCLFEKPGKYRKAYLALLVDYYRADTKGSDFTKRFGLKLEEFEAEWKAWVLK